MKDPKKQQSSTMTIINPLRSESIKDLHRCQVRERALVCQEETTNNSPKDLWNPFTINDK